MIDFTIKKVGKFARVGLELEDAILNIGLLDRAGLLQLMGDLARAWTTLEEITKDGESKD